MTQGRITRRSKVVYTALIFHSELSLWLLAIFKLYDVVSQYTFFKVCGVFTGMGTR